MIKTSINVQDLRRRIALKAKADKAHRFWGLYCHVYKPQVLEAAYRAAKRNGGTHGSDNMSFAQIENYGLARLLEELSEELKNQTYQPLPCRIVEIPKGDGKTRTLKIPAIRDRIVQGAIKTIMEPIFEMDFQDGSFGYRPQRSAHDAIRHIRVGLGKSLHRVLDLDLSQFFDRVRHDILLRKLAARVDDDKLLRLCKVVLKSSGRRGLPQGSIVGPLWANVYLNELDQMLERAQETTKRDDHETIRYARFADDLMVLVSNSMWADHHEWFVKVELRVREIISSLGLEVNETKTRRIAFDKGENLDFLGFSFRLHNLDRKWNERKITVRPQKKKRTAFLKSIRDELKKSRFKPVEEVVLRLNPRVRGWCNYFSWGDCSYDLKYVAWQVEIKIRKFASRQQKVKRGGTSWNSWSNKQIYQDWGLFRARFIKPRQAPIRRPAS